MHKMAFAHVFGPEKKNGFGPFSYKFFVCIRVGLTTTINKRNIVCSLLLRIVCINRGGGDDFTGFREGDREAGRDARPW